MAKGADFYLLSAAFVCSLVLVVDATEVGDDNGDGQSDHQHTAQGADGAEDLPGNRLWHHVTVAGNETDEKKLDKVKIDAWLRIHHVCFHPPAFMPVFNLCMNKSLWMRHKNWHIRIERTEFLNTP